MHLKGAVSVGYSPGADANVLNQKNLPVQLHSTQAPLLPRLSSLIEIRESGAETDIIKEVSPVTTT